MHLRAVGGYWDDISDPPMLCWHRFDLIDSTYAVAMMADITPAWREVYARILDELIFRHTGWWAARDWLTQIGHDPDRANYPDPERGTAPIAVGAVAGAVRAVMPHFQVMGST